MVVPWDQVKKHMHVQTPLDKRRAAGVDLPDRKEREDESSGAGVPEGTVQMPGRRRPEQRSSTGGGARKASASYYEDKELEEIFKRTYGEPKRSYPPGNAWVRERPKPGVQAAWAMEPAAARVQTAQARKRPGAGGRAAAVPGHGGQTARTGRAAGELERQIPAPAQRRNIFWWTATTLFSPGRS